VGICRKYLKNLFIINIYSIPHLNYIDYSSILIKGEPLYDFTLYTPILNYGIIDEDGWTFDFYKNTNQNINNVPIEVSPMNLEVLENIVNKYVPSEGLIVEIGVWANPGNPNMSSTEKIFKTKSENCDYLGIDIGDRPHILGKASNINFLKIDSGNTNEIKEYINTKFQKSIDFLYIDGNHSIEQVKKEIALINLVRKGGVIGFHDISVHAGPNVWLDAFNPDMFEVYKHRKDDDWGIRYMVKKF